jgi:hypothetical protein
MLGKPQKRIVRCLPTQRSSQADQQVCLRSEGVKPPIEGCEADPNALRADSFSPLLLAFCTSLISVFVPQEDTFISLPQLFSIPHRALEARTGRFPKIALAVPIHLLPMPIALPKHLSLQDKGISILHALSMVFVKLDKLHRYREPVDAEVENQLRGARTVAATPLYLVLCDLCRIFYTTIVRKRI